MPQPELRVTQKFVDKFSRYSNITTSCLRNYTSTPQICDSKSILRGMQRCWNDIFSINTTTQHLLGLNIDGASSFQEILLSDWSLASLVFLHLFILHLPFFFLPSGTQRPLKTHTLKHTFNHTLISFCEL